MRGSIYNRFRAAQLRDFSGLLYGNITPTDIDGLIEYKNRCFVFMETKKEGNDLPYGQMLALRRVCDAISNPIKKPSILFITEHNNGNGEDIDFARTIVRQIYHKGTLRNPKTKELTLKSAIDIYLTSLGI